MSGTVTVFLITVTTRAQFFSAIFCAYEHYNYSSIKYPTVILSGLSALCVLRTWIFRGLFRREWERRVASPASLHLGERAEELLRKPAGWGRQWCWVLTSVKALAALCSLYTETKAEWQGGGAFATHWIPVLRERRASRKEREEQTGASVRSMGQRVMLCWGLCCCHDCAVLRQCSVLSLLSWCCDCTVLLLCWGWDVLCCCCAKIVFVVLRLRLFCCAVCWDCIVFCASGSLS